MARPILAAVVAALLLGLVAAGVCSAAPPPIPKYGLPVAMTAPGQSPEYALVKVMTDKIKLQMHNDPLLEAKELKGFKTLILIIGGSGKGLGAAGIDLADEEKRASELIKYCKDNKIPLVGMHLGGEARRGANSAKFIELVTPKCDFVIVRSDGNADGVFTNLCTKGKIPLLLIEKTSELQGILAKMFQ